LKRTGLLLALLLFAIAVDAAEAPVRLEPVRIDLHDQESLQRGARIFVNFCLSCHSAAYMRYGRMGHDLGIDEELLKKSLMFASDQAGSLMTVAMSPDHAKQWFGGVPPDLTVVTRSRGPEWVYNYMRSFYRDEKSPTGWNNTVFPDVAMPHALYGWQGSQRALFEKTADGIPVFMRFELQQPGTMSAKDYDKAMGDLTNFLVYLGEPAKLVRYRIGAYVLIFLAVFVFFAYLLKRDYWSEVH
jgi:ubiquinol-cytochrome c reductase cytochrome c1 subunit